ncbi:MAG: hypothetical protein EP338_14030 [Bacteroidetes bacterium]|nr:MAG: hypothetical protein EP338_14030 [Bacteroidota bacterium]
MRFFVWSGLILSFSIILGACEGQRGRKRPITNAPYRKNLFNPLYIDRITYSPKRCGSIWYPENIDQIDIQQISLVLRASKNGMDLDKHQYFFDSIGRTKSYNFYSFTKSEDIISQMGFRYRKDQLTQIDLFRYHGLSNFPPITCSKNSRFEGFYTSHSGQNNDSLLFYPNSRQPKIIIERLGGQVNHLEIIIDEKASDLQILKRVSRIDTNLIQYQHAEKIITYTREGLPRESFYLDEDWNQLELVKQWEYNQDNQPTHFVEWLHGKKIKDIYVRYNENSLPKRITFNRRKYFLIYRKS